MIPFDINAKYVKQFREVDPFNPGNTIAGYLCRVADWRYGMLYINEVNDKPVPAYLHNWIWATPKMGYPFDKNRKWYFIEHRKVKIYEKFDGTNILSYIYQDHEGNEFVTYKTRFRPILGEGHFGDFKSLWDEVIDMYPEIPEMPFKYRCNISHELYGKKNKVLVEYDTKLDTRILFGRLSDGSVITPDIFTGCGVGTAPLIRTLDSNSDFIEAYEEIRNYLNEHLKVEKEIVDGKERIKMITGLEGTVWYVVNELNRTIQYKAKPDIIFDLHTKASGIPKHSIYITCINAFEDTDNPDFDYIKDLLLEEFEESDIYKKAYTISRILEEVRFEKELKYKVVEDYNRHKDFDINNDKGTVMRWFAKHYDKNICGKIYQLLWREFGR